MDDFYGNVNSVLFRVVGISITAFFFFGVPVYGNQYDISRLLIEKHIIKQQDQQLREYFDQAKEGILIFETKKDVGTGQVNDKKVDQIKTRFVNTSCNEIFGLTVKEGYLVETDTIGSSLYTLTIIKGQTAGSE